MQIELGLYAEKSRFRCIFLRYMLALMSVCERMCACSCSVSSVDTINLVPYNLIINSSILTILDADSHSHTHTSEHIQTTLVSDEWKKNFFCPIQISMATSIFTQSFSLALFEIQTNLLVHENKCMNSTIGIDKKILEFVFYNHDKLDEIACWFLAMLFVIVAVAPCAIDHTMPCHANSKNEQSFAYGKFAIQTQSERWWNIVQSSELVISFSCNKFTCCLNKFFILWWTHTYRICIANMHTMVLWMPPTHRHRHRHTCPR